MKEREYYVNLCNQLLEAFDYADIPADSKHRINHCQAWSANVCLWGRRFILVRSYNTIVAFYDFHHDTLVSIGRYSSTTYQHIRKFRNNYLPSGYKTAEVNIEMVNWYK